MPATIPPAVEPLHARGSRAAVNALYRADETAVVESLLPLATLADDARRRIGTAAAGMVERVRASRTRFGMLDAFLAEFGLSTKEGVALMCLAEALLRIPDAETADSLIRDKIGTADWTAHLGKADNLFVNASTWALMLTGKVVRLDDADLRQPQGFLDRLVSRAGEPVIRQAMVQAMRILGRQFVTGRTIQEALARAVDKEKLGYRYSYDMLGEAARTMADADHYWDIYSAAIAGVGAAMNGRSWRDGPGVSVKLSALHPRYEEGNRDRVIAELTPRLLDLALKAKAAGIHLTVDAEEADRLDLSLDVIERVFLNPALDGWEGFGLVVQAYQKRAYPLIGWLEGLARQAGRRLMIRLVKGAYWDAEIKRAQERGLDGYPVFTRKASTDVSYLACARRLLGLRDVIYPMLATHNATTVAAVMEMAGDRVGYEFQRLHGMGEPLYHQIVSLDMPVRVYGPVGTHEDLLAYLVRRLLENGANSSFVNRIQDEHFPVSEIVADPVARTAALAAKPHPRIPLPVKLYGAERHNSAGLDLSDPAVIDGLTADMRTAWDAPWEAAPIIGGETLAGAARPVTDPADRRRTVGAVVEADAGTVARALERAASGFRAWSARDVAERAACLDRAADAMESQRAALMALLVREAGKTIPDALAEVREAVDFCRYYAAQARSGFTPRVLPGPTGERNELRLSGRGVFVCISPWNFPLAIFMGQVAAALVAGNAVIAKPAEQTPLIAARAVRILLESGVPGDALHLLPGHGAVVGAALVADRRVAGVAFTGSTDTARTIARGLLDRGGAIVPLIAETGGQNAMIVDNSALPEQVVDDVVTSAFRSAGQRCSALRVLFVQDGIAPKVIRMLQGAAAELRLGDPGVLSTDIGPVIDAEALSGLTAHVERMKREATVLIGGTPPDACANGTFLAPHAFEIDSLDRLEREVFGPVLHVVRWSHGHLDRVLEAIEATGYGLTLGVHTRIDRTARTIAARMPVGNIYVNRNMIGAVVGVQPFGGEGLSGTGPKAGGPHYLHRFAAERTVTVNTTAAGGNTSLVSLTEE